MCEWKSTCRF